MSLAASFARWLLCVSCLMPFAALAHSTSTAYLTVEPMQPGEAIQPNEPIHRAQPMQPQQPSAGARAGTAWKLDWRVALRDLDVQLDLDANGDGALTWGETIDRAADIRALATQVIEAGTAAMPCRLAAATPRYVPSNDVAMVAIEVRALCDGSNAQIVYRWFEGIDPTHRLLVTHAGKASPVAHAPGARIAPDGNAGAPASFTGFFVDGLLHIAGGIDHLLFLVTLMLPAVAIRSTRGTTAGSATRAAPVEIAWIVTAFTVAHSLTLAAATFGWVRVPAHVIEPLIALTVLLAALNNVWPVVVRRVRWVAFAFGLVHGFGFAEVLAPLSLPAAELAQALLAFNLGVETGQLAVVAAGFALLAFAARWSGYGRWVLAGGSLAIAGLAAVWTIDRVFDLEQIASRMAALAASAG